MSAWKFRNVSRRLPLPLPMATYQPQPKHIRSLSTTITMPVPNQKHLHMRVPLLKAPSHFGHSTSRVDRPYNEDRYSAFVVDLPAKSTLARRSTHENRQVFNFSIFDGHGGDDCSEFLSQKLSQYIESTPTDYAFRDQLSERYASTIGGYWKLWNRNRSTHFDSYISRMGEHDDLNLRLPIAFLAADFDFTTTHAISGSTCTSVLIYTLDEYSAKGKYYWDPKTISKLYISHVGDTRCIVCDRTGAAHPLTSNHHPSSPIEATRLSRYATSFFTDSFGEERFGAFANTRSFGDLPMKSRGVSAEPDILSYTIGDVAEIRKQAKELGNDYIKIQDTVGEMGGDECFLVMVSDGVSNYATDQEIVDLVMTKHNLTGNATPHDAALEVVKYVEAVGGDDNATCLVIRLLGWGKWPIADRTGELRESKLKDAVENFRRQ